MGACCSCQIKAEKFDGFPIGVGLHNEEDIDHVLAHGEYGARVRVEGGSSKYVSMYSQQGRKGVNQDAMTVWENFTGHKDAVFCAVFDGHGPLGHKVAQHVRDILPRRLSESLKQVHKNSNIVDDLNSVNTDDHGNNDSPDSVYSRVKESILRSFHDVDEELDVDDMIDSYCSGTTAVTVLKKGKHLMIANLGDSRAILCTRGDKDQLIPVQLTVDLKPHLPSECERIRNCKGRIIALEEEPTVFRIWLPDQDCPGLAMARAFGDFCLKDFGVISVPEVYYRKLTDKDEFLVLATDGLWDVLSNDDVIRIVASTRKRSLAARLLVAHAVRAWRYKYPTAKVDDIAVICLFFKRQMPQLTKSVSDTTHLSLNYSELVPNPEPGNIATEDGLETVLNCDVATDTKNHHHHEEKNITHISTSAETHRDGLLNRRRPSRPVEN